MITIRRLKDSQWPRAYEAVLNGVQFGIAVPKASGLDEWELRCGHEKKVSNQEDPSEDLQKFVLAWLKAAVERNREILAKSERNLAAALAPDTVIQARDIRDLQTRCERLEADLQNLQHRVEELARDPSED